MNKYPILVFTNFAFRDKDSFELIQIYENICAYLYSSPDSEIRDDLEILIDEFITEMIEYDKGNISQINNVRDYINRCGEIIQQVDYKNNHQLSLLYSMIYEGFDPHRELNIFNYG